MTGKKKGKKPVKLPTKKPAKKKKKKKKVTKQDILDAVEHPADVLNRKGVTLEYLVEKLKEEMAADRVQFFAYEGRVTDSEVVVDWGTRQRARQDAHKLRGDYAAEKVDLGKGNLSINIHLGEARE